ncbi:hypothetical protein [Mangrovicoccus sp. HB161399]|uniref:hypothetical protein n=1 Tax=Mangrovicoccus sp. HB161399 TaxID=2720392 RepID=UPI001551DA1A|nr:hypothetical protein [Mangrovicoccus sp. HB161399]
MLKINPEINVGNLLTTLSIMIGAATFLYNEVQKRHQFERVIEAEKRDLIGRGVNESLRLENELTHFFLSVEPLYVEVSAAVFDAEAEAGSREKSVERARDALWRGITVARSEMERKIFDQTTLPGGLALVGLEVHDEYEKFRNEHALLRFQAYDELRTSTQNALQGAALKAKHTAEIGNALRNVHKYVKNTYLVKIGRIQDELSLVLADEMAHLAQ